MTFSKKPKFSSIAMPFADKTMSVSNITISLIFFMLFAPFKDAKRTCNKILNTSRKFKEKVLLLVHRLEPVCLQRFYPVYEGETLCKKGRAQCSTEFGFLGIVFL